MTRYLLTIDGSDHDAASFEAVWSLKPTLPERLYRHPDVLYREFLQKQFRAMRDGLRRIFRHKRWLNDPENQQMAENKPYQLSMASQAGFRLPATLVTSDPERAKAFVHRFGRVVVKLLSDHPFLDKMVYTNRIGPSHLQALESLKYAPCIFQECIPKLFELRITVVGDEIFAGKILSQVDPGTEIDYRRKPVHRNDISIEPVRLSNVLKEKTKALMSHLGLRYGCLDVIVTPDGQEVFLEINPNGQWWFIQRETGLPIARAIARLLVS